MGIRLAIAVITGDQRHLDREEAVHELIRESFWMTDDEVRIVSLWAVENNHGLLHTAMQRERYLRKQNVPVGYNETTNFN